MSGGKPVTHAECTSNVTRMMDKIETVHKDIKDIELILRGKEGRNGIVKDVNFLMNQSNTLQLISSTIVGLIAAVLGTVITHYFLP